LLVLLDGRLLLRLDVLLHPARLLASSPEHEEEAKGGSDNSNGEAAKEYKQLVRDWSRSSRASQGSVSNASNGAKPENGQDSPLAGKRVHKISGGQNSEGSRTSSTSSWQEEPSATTMDISTGHMVLSYMEDHLKNKQRLEQEWVGLCAYEAEPNSTAIAFKVENKKKNRYPDKLPYDHNRVLLNALANGTNSDYINASTGMDHDPRNPAYIVTQGPMAHTVADFWQMVWEQGSVVLVMLSRC
jgi:receptor-type tyrosine-protein phosphatase N